MREGTNIVKYKDVLSVGQIRSDLKGKAIIGAGATVLSQLLLYLIATFGIFTLARILSPNDFGLVTMVTSVNVFFKMFRSLGLMDAIVQQENITQDQISTLFWINVASGLLLSILFIAVAPVISWFYDEPRLIWIAVILSVDYVLGGVSTQHRALVKRKLQMYRWASNEICAEVLSFGIAIILAWYGFGYFALAIRIASFALFQAIGSWIICPWRPTAPNFRSGIKSMLKFGINMLGNNFLNFLTESLDKILIGRLNGAESLGHYSRAFHLFLAPAQQLSVPLTSVAVATLSRLTDDYEKFKRYFLNAIEIVSFVGFPISGLLTVTGKDVTLLLLGPQWGEAGEILRIFSVGIGIHILYNCNLWLHMSLGKTDRLVRWSLLSSILICVSFFGGLAYGAVGIATAYTICMHLLIWPALSYAGKPIGLKFQSIVKKTWRFYFAALTGALICAVFSVSKLYVIGIYEELNVVGRLITAGIFYVGIYLGVVILLFGGVRHIKGFVNIVNDVLPKRAAL